MQKISKIIFFVNGYTKNCRPLLPYWTEKGSQFLDAANQYFGGNCEFEFVNGEGPWYSSAKFRSNKGKLFANSFIPELKEKLSEKAEIYFVTHSMGSAFSEGMISRFMNADLPVKKVVHLSVADAENIKIADNSLKIQRLQVSISGDKTTRFYANPFAYFKFYKIPAVTIYGEILSNVETFHPTVSKKDQNKWNFHYDTKTFAYVWKYITVLEEIKSINQVSDEILLPKSEYLFKKIHFNKNYYCLDINSVTTSHLRYKLK